MLGCTYKGVRTIHGGEKDSVVTAAADRKGGNIPSKGLISREKDE